MSEVDIREAAIRKSIELTLPIGNEDSKLTEENIHKIKNVPSSRDIALDEKDAVLVEFRDGTSDSKDAVTNKYGDHLDIVNAIDRSMRVLAQEHGHELHQRVVESEANRLVYEVRAELPDGEE